MDNVLEFKNEETVYIHIGLAIDGINLYVQVFIDKMEHIGRYNLEL